jgi:hypothetical protein
MVALRSTMASSSETENDSAELARRKFADTTIRISGYSELLSLMK